MSVNNILDINWEEFETTVKRLNERRSALYREYSKLSDLVDAMENQLRGIRKIPNMLAEAKGFLGEVVPIDTETKSSLAQAPTSLETGQRVSSAEQPNKEKKEKVNRLMSKFELTKDLVEKIWQVSIDKLELPTNIRKPLSYSGFRTIGDLLEKEVDDLMSSVRNIGWGRVEKIRARIMEYVQQLENTPTEGEIPDIKTIETIPGIEAIDD